MGEVFEDGEVEGEAWAVGAEAACARDRVAAAGAVEGAACAAEGREHGFELEDAGGADLEVVHAA